MKAFPSAQQISFSVESQDSFKFVPTANQTNVISNAVSETRSFKKNQNPLETSFEKQANYEYPSLIWDASIAYLKNSYKEKICEDAGLNNENIFPELCESEQEGKDFEDLINSNKLLSDKDKRLLLLDLKYEPGFKSMLENLSAIFKHQIFQEILLVCNCTWEKYLTFKQTNKMGLDLQNMNLSTILDFDEIDDLPPSSEQFIPFTAGEILEEARKTAEEISGMIFLQKGVKFINLMEAEGKKRREIREEFTKFIESITKGVFLCLEGYYVTPETEMDDDLESIDLLGDDEFQGSDKEDSQDHSLEEQPRKYKKLI